MFGLHWLAPPKAPIPPKEIALFTDEEKKLLNTLLVNSNKRLESDEFLTDASKQKSAALLKSINKKVLHGVTAPVELPKEISIGTEGKSPITYQIKD